ncbi:MAG: zinc ribbon domain-containing protein [Deltaproteobacteria bacterium]|nr:zinc ribbon domain-containing protein [Deltaproteobacteria bacterium]
MAIHEYRCAACGHSFEVWTMFHDEPRCPSCGDTRVSRQISQTSFVLKGSGWYATDYRGSKPAPATPASGDATPSCTAGSKPECATCPAAGAHP